jgi:hypothetical protein
MDDRTLIASVVKRYQRRVISAIDWFGDSEALEWEDARDSVKKDVRSAGGYIKKCQYLASIFRSLSGPLQTPAIGVEADKIDQRIKDTEQLVSLLQEGVIVAKKLDKEWETLMKQIVDGLKLPHGIIEAVQDLPSMIKMYQLAKESGVLQEKLMKEEEDYSIDWGLDVYLNSEAIVYQKIEKAAQNNSFFSDALYGASTLYGVIALYLDLDNIQEWLANLRDADNTT